MNMTNTNTASLLERVEELTAALVQAQEDVALLGRLTTAKATAKRLSAELTEAQDALSVAMADEVRAKRAALYAGFTDIKIIEGNLAEGLQHRTFQVNYTREEWNGTGSLITRSVMGFEAMPDGAWAYLLDVRPDQIPASILALSPTGDPTEAFNTYFTGMKRGWLSAPVAEADAA
jgi:hypothetical protein